VGIYAQQATATRTSATDARSPVQTKPLLTTGEQTAAPPDAVGLSMKNAPAATSLVPLRRALDHSPRVQAQFALQRMLNQGANVAAGPLRQSTRNVFQLARLNLRKADGTISGVSDWPHRPSSNVSRGQGQHLTAYASYTDMILSHVRDRTVVQAAKALIDVLGWMQQLPGGDYWYGQYGDTVEINKQLLQQAAKDDDAGLVGGVIDNILSLRNKMPDTAIGTSEQTWGHGEAKTSGSLETLESILRQNGGALPTGYDDQTEAAAALFNMWRLLDYQPTSGASQQAFDKTKDRVLRHVMQMRLSYPQVFTWLSNRGSWLMPYIKAHRTDDKMPLSNLNNTEIEQITKYVHGGL
jgi:hypothetical protein